MRRWSGLVYGVLTATLGAASCTTLLGIDQDYRFTADSSGSGGGAASSASDSGSSSGGGLASSASSGSTGGGGGGCVVLRSSGGTCEYLPGSGCGCSGVKKCSVANETTGASDCIMVGASPLPAWNKCNGDTDCQGGTWCDHSTHTCKTICNGAGDCSKGAQCRPALQTDGKTAIPDLRICTAHCDPESASLCGATTTCMYDSTISEFDCFESKNYTDGTTCVTSTDCAAGLVCVTVVGLTTCHPWCHPVDKVKKNPKCPAAKPYCDPLQVVASYNGVDYGSCDP